MAVNMGYSELEKKDYKILTEALDADSDGKISI
jgi:hypothetical protein